jgi:hypothetical protein
VEVQETKRMNWKMSWKSKNRRKRKSKTKTVHTGEIQPQIKK